MGGPNPQGLGGIVCGCTAIPWIVVFYWFAFLFPDGEQGCWIIPDDLRVSQVQTDDTARDVAALWRLFYTWGFVIYLCLGVLPTVAGCLICVEQTMVVGFVCMGCAGIAFLFKSAIFWWCVVLRATQEGKVASGKMVMECEAKWGTSAVPATADTTAATDDTATRLLQDTATGDSTVVPQDVMDSIQEALSQASPVCNDMDAFQTKGGKFMLAWIIISAVKCV